MPRTPFHDVFATLGANFGEFSGWEMPRHFAGLAAEVLKARTQGGIVDLSHWSKLKISGADAAEFAHNYTTHHIKGLAEGSGLQTAVTTWKGTMIDHVFVYRLEDGLRMIGHPGTGPVIAQALRKFMFNVDVSLEDVTEARGMLYVFGPHAVEILEAASDETLSEIPMHGFKLVSLDGSDALVARTWPLFGGGFRVLIPEEQAAVGLRAILRAGQALDVPLVGLEAYERLRIEAGMPSFPQEINEERNPWEVRLADSVSMNKGCYLGQEVIARLANYQKVQRHLVGLRLARPVEPGQSLVDEDGKAVGKVTSVAVAPDGERPVALGFLKPDWAQEGKVVRVSAGEGVVEAEVRDLPFWKDRVGGGVTPRY